MEETVVCPVCPDRAPRAWATEYRGYRIVRCPGCGLRFVSPRRSVAEDRAFYDAGYFERQRQREADPDLRRWVDATDQHYVDTILRHVRVARPRVLDVGIGRGSFAIRMAARPEVASVAGTDVTEANADHLAAHGIQLHVGDLAELELPPYDVITAHHVLEHVTHPNPFLDRIRGLLTERGILHLVLPNEGSLQSKWKSALSRTGLKPRPFRHLSPDHHLFFHTPATLRRLLAARGFEVLHDGTMAGAKPRSAPNRWLHAALDGARANAWLECVAAPRAADAAAT